jgi:hypothetical protein
VELLAWVEAVASRCQGALAPVMPLILMSILQTVVMLRCTPTSKSNASVQFDKPFDISSAVSCVLRVLDVQNIHDRCDGIGSSSAEIAG